MENHTIDDLRMLQALPLDIKIAMTCTRIRAWVNEYGFDGVYISFSGGKDSTVLLDIARNECGYDYMKAMFIDVPTQYPELKHFVMSFENVDVVKPKISFVEVCKKYGFPLISKDVAAKTYLARKYNPEIDPVKYSSAYIRFTDDCKYPQFNVSHYKYMLDAPFDISDTCCKIMKKDPAKKYEKLTGRHPIMAQMAVESRLRTMHWLNHGCNAFNGLRPISNPMAFWTEQDILQYIYERQLKICSVYGKVIKEDGIYKTTGCKRTGCMLCGFGIHLEKSPNRFEMLKESHPGMYKLLDTCSNNGVSFREAIEWCNEHGNLNIKL